MKRMVSSSFFHVVLREFGRITNSWVLIFVTIVGPVTSFLLIAWMFSATVVRELPVTLVDMDHSQLSRTIARMIDASPAMHVANQVTSLNEANSTIAKGVSDAVLYIPQGLEKQVQKGLQTELALFFNNTNVIKGGIIQSQMVSTISTVSGAIKVQSMVKKGLPYEEALKNAVPILPAIHLLFNPFGNYAYFLMMGLLPLLIVVFIFLGTSYAIGIEMKEGTATAWLHQADNSAMVAIIGKLTPYILMFFADMMAMNILLIKVMGIPLNGSLTIILLSEFLLILAYQAMAILFLTLTVNLRLTLSLGSAYTMMALTFSGLTFPVLGMSWVARIFSIIFPYTYWLRAFLSQTMRGEPIHEAIGPMVLLLPFILTGIFVLPIFKRRFANERWQSRE